MLSDPPTITSFAIFNAVLFGLILLWIINFIVWKAIGRKKWFLSLLDLISFAIAGITFGSVILVGFNTFSAEYLKVLDAKGLTNEREPYAAIYSQIRERYDAICPDGDITVDCKAMHHFIRSVWVDAANGEFHMVQYVSTPLAGADAETVKLIQAYQAEYARAPKPMEIAAEMFKHLNVYYVFALALAWSFGMVRRTILFIREYNSS